jgi:hypothetical protein
MKRPQMNDLKQKWKDFTIWVVKKYGYENLHISKAIITYNFYFGNKRRHDNDNYVCKFTNDGLVDSGIVVDDDYLHLNPLIKHSDYDKEHPRMEILIETKD